jgi:hypothetical protein
VTWSVLCQLTEANVFSSTLNNNDYWACVKQLFYPEPYMSAVLNVRAYLTVSRTISDTLIKHHMVPTKLNPQLFNNPSSGPGKERSKLCQFLDLHIPSFS